MDGNITVKYLQNYIREKDYHPELLKDYFMRLTEEVGEVSRAIQKGGVRATSEADIKDTIDEEVWDVIYYAIAIANIYGIDLEKTIKAKATYNEKRYPSPVKFEVGR